LKLCLNGSKIFISISKYRTFDENALKLSQGFGVNNTKHRLNLFTEKIVHLSYLIKIQNLLLQK
jgi:hypothetical protein